MVDAMSYEYLIRRIYNVGRYGTEGADADHYRRLENAEHLYIQEKKNIERGLPRLRSEGIESLKYETNVQAQKIWRKVKKAIQDGISENSSLFTQEEVDTMTKSIIEPKILSKEYIDKAIKITEDIYVKYEIYPR